MRSFVRPFVLYVRATPTRLLRGVRTRGTGQLVRHGTHTLRVPALGMPHVPRTTYPLAPQAPRAHSSGSGLALAAVRSCRRTPGCP